MNLSSSLALLPSEWKLQSSVPTLNDETHIWAIQLQKSPPYQQQQFQWLSTREKSKAQRMRVDIKRDYQIQARAWLRWLLAAYVDTTPEQIKYRYGPLGKPYLQTCHRQVYFNATDSGSTLLCAFSTKHELGLDVESTPRQVKFKRIAERKFTRKEQQALNSLYPYEQSNGFLAIWTRKEAFGKALGIGIRYPMNQYHLCDSLQSHYHQTEDQYERNWGLIQFAYNNNIACLVSRQDHQQIHFYKLDNHE